jgi:MFS family permease
VSPRAYVTLLRTPGVTRLAAAFLALGIGNTMTPVAFVLFARAATGSFASASLVLAASTAGGLVLGPARGRLIDRVGARRAVLRLAVPDVATDVAFIVGGHAHAAAGLLVALGFISGAVTAPVVAAVRSTWSQSLTDEATRQAGYALMTMLQETSFIGGPLLAGALIGVWSVTAAVIGTTVLSFAGAVGFVVSDDPGDAADPSAAGPGGGGRGRQDRPPGARRHAGRLPALAGRGIRTVLACSAGFGLSFGLLDVAFPAFARDHGSAAGAGVLLSAFAVGSFAGGFLYGLRSRAGPSGPRYPWLCLLAALGLAPLILEPGLAAMAALAAVSGLCFAPVSTAQFAVVDEVAAPDRRAESFTWLSTVYGTGLAAGAAVCGQLIVDSGIRAALIAACLATLAAGLVATARAASLRDSADGQGSADGMTEGASPSSPR